MTGFLSKTERFAALPPVWPHALLESIRGAAAGSNRTLVVLDDDPTGTQTVHDVVVLTEGTLAALRGELASAPPCFYVLTNSRSLTPDDARHLNRETAANLAAASAATGRAVTVVSRSDSTLRGHFPLETDVLNEVLGPFDATFLIPYFEAGGRYTLDNVHYVAERDRLIPAADTPFARDTAFGYRASDLRDWVEEKTGGRVKAREVACVSIAQLRREGPEAVAAFIEGLPTGTVCAVNACAPRDLEVFGLASLLAERRGRRLLYRTAASFVAARLGLEPRPLLGGRALGAPSPNGGLTVAGSHVPKTTAQLARLLRRRQTFAVELDAERLARAGAGDKTVDDAIAEMNHRLGQGCDVVVFTSRAVLAGADAAGSLAIGRRISEALVRVVRGLAGRPRYLIAKGGITSSDIASLALGVKRARVWGQILPGVPVWRLGEETRFPGMPYVVFPGNVGDEDALVETAGRFDDPSAGR